MREEPKKDPKTGTLAWPKCAACGLSAPDLVERDGAKYCPTSSRCLAVVEGESLGGPQWKGRGDATTA